MSKLRRLFSFVLQNNYRYNPVIEDRFHPFSDMVYLRLALEISLKSELNCFLFSCWDTLNIYTVLHDL